MMHTQQEINIWKERLNDSEYATETGRIIKNANSFLLNQSTEIWKHNLKPIKETPPETNPPIAVKPFREGIKLRDATFLHLLGETKYDNVIKSTLLKQVREPSVNFTSIHPNNPNGYWTYSIGSQPPMFHVAEWVTTLLHAYEYSKNIFTSSEQNEIETWFHNSGKFFNENVSRMFDRLFVDRKNGNYALSGYSIEMVKNNSHKNMSTHIGGHKIHALAAWNYQNRQASQARTVAEVGVLVGDENLKSAAKKMVQEFVAFWIFPSGLTNEFHRGSVNYPEAGFYYSFMQVEILLSIADLFARHGDTSLFDYKTSKGWFGTEGGEKSLWLVARTLCQLKNGEYHDKLNNSNKLYVVKRDPYYLIDGREEKNYFTKTPLIYVQEIYLAQYNIYFNDKYVKDTYMKALNNTTRISSAGPHHWDQGVWGVHPSKRLMYWDLEGKINPYSDIPTEEPIEKPMITESINFESSSLVYSEGWTSGAGLTYSNQSGANIAGRIKILEESQITVKLETFDTHGIAIVSLGDNKSEVDCYSSTKKGERISFEIDPGEYDFKVEVSGRSNELSKNTYIVFFGIDIEKLSIEIPPVEIPKDDVLISRHSDPKEAYEVMTGRKLTRTAYYEVWERPDGKRYMKQPNIEVE